MFILYLSGGLKRTNVGPITAKSSPVSAGLSNPILKLALSCLILRELKTSVTKTFICFNNPLVRRILSAFLASLPFSLAFFGLTFFGLAFFFLLPSSLPTKPNSHTSFRLDLVLPWTSRWKDKSSGMLRTSKKRATRLARAIISHN